MMGGTLRRRAMIVARPSVVIGRQRMRIKDGYGDDMIVVFGMNEIEHDDLRNALKKQERTDDRDHAAVENPFRKIRRRLHKDLDSVTKIAVGDQTKASISSCAA